MEPPASIRVGIVGLGNIGQHHAERIHASDLGFLAGGLDVSPAARERFTETFGVDTYENRDSLFAAVDAVIVTTPNAYHEEYVLDALDAGIDVLLEKPLAHTLESAERIAGAAREADAICMVGFNNRFSNTVEIIEHYRDEGRFGDLTHVDANYVRRRGIPGRGSWFTRTDVAGGGALLDIGVHAIDLSLAFLAFPEVVEVSGVTRTEFGHLEDYAYLEQWGEDNGPEGFDVDDSATAFVRCADGKTISLDVAWATNGPNDEEYLLRGTDGGVRFDRETQDLTFYGAGAGGANHLTDTTVRTQPSDTHRAEQMYFLDHVARGERPAHNTVEQALAVQRVLNGIYRSSAEGSAVRLD